MSAQPKRRSVDQQVRDFYRRQGLAPGRAQALLDAARRRAAARRRWLIAAAAVLVTLGGAALVRSVLQARALADRVAAEVAMGHHKDLDVEIATSSYVELGRALDKLSFPLLEPGRLAETRAATADPAAGPPSPGAGYELVGGRYCSIQAQLAALLKVRDGAGRMATLYVTDLSPELSSLPGTERAHDGVEIEIWTERGLLYALARSP